jgi:hypothetical protein
MVRKPIDTKIFTFGITHFSDYAVAYNKVSFIDVTTDAWYYKSVSSRPET